MEICAVAEQVSLEKMQRLYEQNEMNALKGAVEAQVMIQSEITAMIQEILPHLAQNIDTLV